MLSVCTCVRVATSIGSLHAGCLMRAANGHHRPVIDPAPVKAIAMGMVSPHLQSPGMGWTQHCWLAQSLTKTQLHIAEHPKCLHGISEYIAALQVITACDAHTCDCDMPAAVAYDAEENRLDEMEQKCGVSAPSSSAAASSASP